MDTFVFLIHKLSTRECSGTLGMLSVSQVESQNMRHQVQPILILVACKKVCKKYLIKNSQIFYFFFCKFNTYLQNHFFYQISLSSDILPNYAKYRRLFFKCLLILMFSRPKNSKTSRPLSNR